MNRTQDAAALVGRILLVLIFLTSGFGKLTEIGGTAGYIASKGLPMPQVLAVVSGLVEVVGGLMIAVGFKARWAALALAGFTLVAGFIFHDYWNADAASQMMQNINFWKNVSMAGGFLVLFAFGPGRIALDKEAP